MNPCPSFGRWSSSRLVFWCLVVGVLSVGWGGVGSKVVLPLEDEEAWPNSSPLPSPTSFGGEEGHGSRGTEDLDSAETEAVEGGAEEDDPFHMSATQNDPEYLDDGVTFVTDEEVLYDDQTPSSSSFPNSNNYLQQRVGESRVGGSHWTEKCPPLPDTSSSGVHLGLCEMRACERDEECSADGSFVCCYNGCIHSCLPKVNPPPAFDWLEETILKTPGRNESDEDGTSASKNLRNLMDSSVSPDEIALPGGCYINSQQYEDLILFRKFEHVKSCTCSKGEVFCEVNPVATPTREPGVL